MQELPAERTATTRTFRNADGTTTLRTYPEPVNVRRPDGGWDKADLDLEPANAGRLEPKSAPYPTSFAPVAVADGLATMALDDDHTIAFGVTLALHGRTLD